MFSRRWLRVTVISTSSLAAIFVIASIGADRLIERRMTAIAECLAPSGTVIDELDAEGNAVVALATGSLGGVSVRATGVQLGPRTLDATLHLSDVALRRGATQRVGSVTGTVTSDVEGLATTIALTSDLPPGVTLKLGAGDNSLSLDLDGASVPVSISLVPTIVDDRVLLRPESVRVGSRTFSPALVPLRNPLTAAVLEPREVALPSLPDSVQITSVTAVGDRLAFDFDVDATGTSGLMGERIRACA